MKGCSNAGVKRLCLPSAPLEYPWPARDGLNRESTAHRRKLIALVTGQPRPTGSRADSTKSGIDAQQEPSGAHAGYFAGVKTRSHRDDPLTPHHHGQTHAVDIRIAKP